MNDLEVLMAKAQIALAFLYNFVFLGIFIIVAVLWDRLSKMDVGLLTMFATASMNQSKDAGSYFFARQRTAGLPDPASQMVVQERILPDGTKTTVTSPAATTAVVAGTNVQKTGAIPNAKPITTNPAPPADPA